MSLWMQSLVVFFLLAIPPVLSSVATCYEADFKFAAKGLDFPAKNIYVPKHSNACPFDVTMCTRFSVQGVSRGRNVSRTIFECDRRQFCERLGVSNGCQILNDTLLYRLFDVGHEAAVELCCCTGENCNHEGEITDLTTSTTTEDVDVYADEEKDEAPSTTEEDTQKKQLIPSNEEGKQTTGGMAQTTVEKTTAATGIFRDQPHLFDFDFSFFGN